MCENDCCCECEPLTVGVGMDVPDFTMDVYDPENRAFGKVSLDELKKDSKWTVLVFYPADFTFVCPTELADLADAWLERAGRAREEERRDAWVAAARRVWSAAVPRRAGWPARRRPALAGGESGDAESWCRPFCCGVRYGVRPPVVAVGAGGANLSAQAYLHGGLARAAAGMAMTAWPSFTTAGSSGP